MSKDILEQMTKAELIAWINKTGLRRPMLSDLLYHRWEIGCAKHQEKYDAELKRFADLNLDFKKRDALANEFNQLGQQAGTAERRLDLLEQIEVYDRHLSQHMAAMRKLDREQERLDRLYTKAQNLDQ